MRKKILQTLVLALPLALLLSCGPPTPPSPSPPPSPDTRRNVLSVFAPQGDALSLLHLLQEGNTHIYSFDVNASFKTVSVWCDLYRDGALVWTSLVNRLELKGTQHSSGLIAIIYDAQSVRTSLTSPSWYADHPEGISQFDEFCIFTCEFST